VKSPTLRHTVTVEYLRVGLHRKEPGTFFVDICDAIAKASLFLMRLIFLSAAPFVICLSTCFQASILRALHGERILQFTHVTHRKR
jgi:hypothetical protein